MLSTTAQQSATMSHKIGSNQSTESMLLHLLSRLDQARQRAIQKQRKRYGHHYPISFTMMRHEIRTFDLWRSVIAECLASFLYVFLLCCTHLTWTGSTFIFGSTPNWLIIALCSGFSMATLIQCFGHISGGHVNPAVTVAFLFTKRISPLRAILYIIAHCSGAIAGAALLYGVTVTNSSQMHSMGPLGITTGHDSLNVWQIFTFEFLLTFIVVLATYATIDPNRKSFGSDSLSIGIAYMVASLAGLPASGASINPARSLGPAFVMNRWQHHWVYWAGPLLGAIVSAILYEFIFDMKRRNRSPSMSTNTGGVLSSSSLSALSQLQTPLSFAHNQQLQHQQYLQHHYQTATQFGATNPRATGKFFPSDQFDFDIERDSNVDDDYEDPELSAAGLHGPSATTKLTMANHHTKLYPTSGGPNGCSASAASSGSSSGHSRSNHTQHSIVSVHGQPNASGPGGPFESYRPMIPTAGATTTIQEVSPQIYNEPTNGSNYYQSASDRSANNSSGGSGANGSTNPNAQQQTGGASSTPINTAANTSSFFHSLHPSGGDRSRPPLFGSAGAATLRQQQQQQSGPPGRLSYDHHQSIMGPKF